MGQSSNLSNFQELCNLKGCKFSFLNIRSLNANLNPLKADLVSAMSIQENCIVAIGLSESWLNGKLHNALFNIHGFTFYRQDRVLGKRGGGIAVYVNDKYAVDQVPEEFNVSNGDIELYSIIIIMPNQKNCLFTTVYIPPKLNYVNGLQVLEKCSVLLDNVKMHWVIGGDFNLGKGSRVNEKAILTDFQHRNNLSQLIKSPTRSAKSSASVIDLIFTSNDELVSQAGVIPYSLSDHDMIYVNFKKRVKTKNKLDMSFKCRDMRN